MTLLIPVKHSCGKCRKPLEQINILDAFTNTDIDVKVFEYPVSWQEKIARPLVKDILKIITPKEFVTANKILATKKILMNQLLNPSNINEIQNADTDKANNKNHPVNQAYNDKDKNFLLMLLLTKNWLAVHH